MTTLLPNEPAPALSVPKVDSRNFSLSDQKPKGFTMIVFYRGYHCPICKDYLGELNRRAAEFEAVGTDVVAISMDDAERAARSVEEWGLDRIGVGHSLDEAAARRRGLYLSTALKESEPRIFSEPGLFLIDPAGKLYLINISSMPFARPQLEGLADKLRFVRDKNYPARGVAA